MNSRTETVIADNGAKVEVGTVTFQGKDFSALGSVVNEADGVVIGYVKHITEGDDQWGRKHVCPFGCRYELRTWNGEKIADLKVTGRWDARVPGQWRPVAMTGFRMTLNGRTYSGRKGADADLIVLRAPKVAA